MDAPRSDRLASLTGLRFGAAFGILLFHYGAPLLAGAPEWVERARAGGYAWVGLFYVLSGFVLARANPEAMAPKARRAFWAARLARLYPVYLLAFLLVAPFALDRWAAGGPLAAAKAVAVAAASLLLVQAWAPPIARLWNAPGWSTSVTAAFYAAFPFVVAPLSRLSRRGLALALACFWAASLAPPLAYLALGPEGTNVHATWHEPFWIEALKFHPVARAGEFGVGVALGLLHRRGLEIRRHAGVAAAAALATALAVLAWGRAPYVLVHNGLLVPLYAVAILALARGRGLLARALGSAPGRALGDASFALYALQEPLWSWARHLFGVPGAGATRAFAAAFAATAVALSVVVSRVLERPARRAMRAALAGDWRRRVRALPPQPDPASPLGRDRAG